MAVLKKYWFKVKSYQYWQEECLGQKANVINDLAIVFRCYTTSLADGIAEKKDLERGII